MSSAHGRRLPDRDESLGIDEHRCWFDEVYRRFDDGEAAAPWDRRGAPNELLRDWAQGTDGAGGRAAVIGCGYGDDAEFIAGLGFDTLAFDFSSAALEAARQRYPRSRVDYRFADLLDLPPIGTFGFVFESLTVQSLPRPMRSQAIGAVRSLVAPGGNLLVIAGRMQQGFDESTGPWLLSREDMDAFGTPPLHPVSIEVLPGEDAERWRGWFSRARD